MEDGCLGEAVSGGKPVSRINPSGEESAIGSIAVQRYFSPGNPRICFYLTWHLPNRYAGGPMGMTLESPFPVPIFIKIIILRCGMTRWR